MGYVILMGLGECWGVNLEFERENRLKDSNTVGHGLE